MYFFDYFILQKNANPRKEKKDWNKAICNAHSQESYRRSIGGLLLLFNCILDSKIQTFHQWIHIAVDVSLISGRLSFNRGLRLCRADSPILAVLSRKFTQQGHRETIQHPWWLWPCFSGRVLYRPLASVLYAAHPSTALALSKHQRKW